MTGRPFSKVRNLGFLLIPACLAFSSCTPESGSDPGPDAPVWVLEEPDVRIGSATDPDYSFDFVRALAMSPVGILHSIHNGEASIRRWTPDGRPAGTVGRQGEGPGEFSRPINMGFFGDSLWVMDLGNYSFSYFDLEGAFLGSLSPTVDVSRDSDNPYASAVRPSLPLRDGTVYGISSAPSGAVATGELTESRHARLDSEGEELGTVWVRDYRPMDTRALLRESGGGTFMPQPFGDRPLTAYPNDGSLLVLDRRISEGEDPAAVTVTRIAMTGDTVSSFAIPYAPVPLPEEVVDSNVRETAGSILEFYQRLNIDMGLARLEEDLRAATFVPSHYPGAANMVVSDDGTIWLQWPVATGGNHEWRVYSEQGEWLARVHIPTDLNVMLITADAVWGVETDDLDVNYIVRFGVVRSG